MMADGLTIDNTDAGNIAEPGDLYDLRVLHDIILQPGQPRQVSRRTMQGLTEYILSVYNAHDYEGIYVYISAQAVQSRAQLQDGLLPIMRLSRPKSLKS